MGEPAFFYKIFFFTIKNQEQVLILECEQIVFQTK